MELGLRRGRWRRSGLMELRLRHRRRGRRRSRSRLVELLLLLHGRKCRGWRVELRLRRRIRQRRSLMRRKAARRARLPTRILTARSLTTLELTARSLPARCRMPECARLRRRGWCAMHRHRRQAIAGSGMGARRGVAARCGETAVLRHLRNQRRGVDWRRASSQRRRRMRLEGWAGCGANGCAGRRRQIQAMRHARRHALGRGGWCHTRPFGRMEGR